MAEPALSGRTSPDRDDHRGRQETIPRQEDSEERLPYPAGQCPVFDVDRRSGKPSPHQHSVLLLFAGPELLLPLRPRFVALQEPRAESIDGYDGHELVADVGWQRPRDPAVRDVPSSPRAGRERGGAAVRSGYATWLRRTDRSGRRGADLLRSYAFYRFVPTRIKILDEAEFGGAAFVIAGVTRRHPNGRTPAAIVTWLATEELRPQGHARGKAAAE